MTAVVDRAVPAASGSAVIALEKASARTRSSWFKTPAQVKDVSFAWERGVLAVLGGPADGTTVLLDLLAGALPLRSGRAQVLGGAPVDARARVAHVPLVPVLPEALRVDELCALAGELRGEPRQPAAARLGVLGLEGLADRRVRHLSPTETRALALAIALTSKAPVVLVDEPLAGLDAAAPARVVAALRERASQGAAVVITTSSVRDATRLGDQLGVLTQGNYTHLPASLAHAGPGGARLRVVVSVTSAPELEPFVEALAAEPGVASLVREPFVGTRVLSTAVAVVVSGPELLALARAIGKAAASTQANVLAIESGVMPLGAIRAALAGPEPGLVARAPAPPSPPEAESPAPEGSS